MRNKSENNPRIAPPNYRARAPYSEPGVPETLKPTRPSTCWVVFPTSSLQPGRPSGPEKSSVKVCLLPGRPACHPRVRKDTYYLCGEGRQHSLGGVVGFQALHLPEEGEFQPFSAKGAVSDCVGAGVVVWNRVLTPLQLCIGILAAVSDLPGHKRTASKHIPYCRFKDFSCCWCPPWRLDHSHLGTTSTGQPETEVCSETRSTTRRMLQITWGPSCESRCPRGQAATLATQYRRETTKVYWARSRKEQEWLVLRVRDYVVRCGPEGVLCFVALSTSPPHVHSAPHIFGPSSVVANE